MNSKPNHPVNGVHLPASANIPVEQLQQPFIHGSIQDTTDAAPMCSIHTTIIRPQPPLNGCHPATETSVTKDPTNIGIETRGSPTATGQITPGKPP